MVLLFPGFWLIFARNLRIRFLNWQALPRAPWLTTTGVSLTLAGLIFAVLARTYLGTNWSGTVTLKAGHELVRAGPYRWVRHPIYSGLLLATLGTAIERDETRGIVAMALIYAGFLIKIRAEEQFMRNAFGVQYDQYKDTTGALFPHLNTRSRKNTPS